MNKLIIAPALAAAAVAAGTTLEASAQTTVAYATTPIEITNFSARPPYSLPVPFSNGAYMNVDDTNEITVTFINRKAVAATKVRFAIHTAKGDETVTDAGTFAQGRTIKHSFSIEPQLGRVPDVEVASVTFADGTVWQR